MKLGASVASTTLSPSGPALGLCGTREIVYNPASTGQGWRHDANCSMVTHPRRRGSRLRRRDGGILADRAGRSRDGPDAVGRRWRPRRRVRGRGRLPRAGRGHGRRARSAAAFGSCRWRTRRPTSEPPVVARSTAGTSPAPSRVIAAGRADRAAGGGAPERGDRRLGRLHRPPQCRDGVRDAAARRLGRRRLCGLCPQRCRRRSVRGAGPVATRRSRCHPAGPCPPPTMPGSRRSTPRRQAVAACRVPRRTCTPRAFAG